MASFACIDENNIVTKVLVVHDECDTDEKGQDFLVNTCGLQGVWKKTSYNTIGGVHSLGGTPLRKNFAGKGMTYDPQRDAFYYEKPFPSWILNEDSCIWEPPTPMPIGNGIYVWDETTLQWISSI